MGNNAKEPFIEDPSTWNEVIPRENTAAADRLHDPEQKTRKTTHGTLSSARRRFLFLNLGDEAILKYTSGDNPPWTNLYPNELSLKGNKALRGPTQREPSSRKPTSTRRPLPPFTTFTTTSRKR